MSDYEEKLNSVQTTGTLSITSQLHTLLGASHFLREQILKETMLKAGHCFTRTEWENWSLNLSPWVEIFFSHVTVKPEMTSNKWFQQKNTC